MEKVIGKVSDVMPVILFLQIICMGELRCKLVRGWTVSLYEQFETSPETIEQELRPAVCEQRQTDLRRIILWIIIFCVS